MSLVLTTSVKVLKNKESHLKNQLGKLPTPKRIIDFGMTDVLLDSDATSFYASATWDEKSIGLEVETGFAFRPDSIDEIVEKFITQTFTQSSAILYVL